MKDTPAATTVAFITVTKQKLSKKIETRGERVIRPFRYISPSPQRFTHRCAGICLDYGIEVAVDICRGAHAAMSEPFLDLLHGHALCKEYRGAGVAQIAEADFLQIMLLKKLPKVSGDEVWDRRACQVLLSRLNVRTNKSGENRYENDEPHTFCTIPQRFTNLPFLLSH